ncbi:MAG TPA: hypothetical protein VG755_36355 [Nannocystaceae bacterium]|nr:hypothetical protein [Nannocystaceae bacterium]
MTQLDALLRTLTIEAVVGLLALAVLARTQLRDAGWRAPAVLMAASLLTHPFAWWGNRALLGVIELWPRYAIVELCVVAIETIVLQVALRIGWPIAAATSLLMNAASFGFGLRWMWR